MVRDADRGSAKLSHAQGSSASDERRLDGCLEPLALTHNFSPPTTTQQRISTTRTSLQTSWMVTLRLSTLYVASIVNMVAVALPVLLACLAFVPSATALYPIEDVQYAPGFAVLPPPLKDQKPQRKAEAREIDLVCTPDMLS